MPMLDFTIQNYWQCAGSHIAHIGGYVQTNLFDEHRYPQCTCKAYKFGKRTINFGGQLYPNYCKHIVEAEKQICGWHSLYSSEPMLEEGVCPKCGGKAESVQVGV
jgi:hypothetical protein